MRFKDVFSIIGPVMIGPSSSHTAGAVQIGRVASQLFGEVPAAAQILFYGSFAATYAGHGTDRAIVGGLLDLATDDLRIPRSLHIAAQLGIKVQIEQGKGLFVHPNTAKITLVDHSSQKQLSIVGKSIGGGTIEIVEIDGFQVKMTGLHPALVLCHHDVPGVIAEAAQLINQEHNNIAYMSVDRKSRSGDAMTVLELDAPPSAELLERLARIGSMRNVRTVDLQRASSKEMELALRSLQEGAS